MEQPKKTKPHGTNQKKKKLSMTERLRKINVICAHYLDDCYLNDSLDINEIPIKLKDYDKIKELSNI